jgi:hypothetical protein
MTQEFGDGLLTIYEIALSHRLQNYSLKTTLECGAKAIVASDSLTIRRFLIAGEWLEFHDLGSLNGVIVSVTRRLCPEYLLHKRQQRFVFPKVQEVLSASMVTERQ